MVQFDDEASADRLGEIISRDSDPRVRSAAVAGLGLSRNMRAVLWLLESVENSKDPHVQFRAIKEIYRKLGMTYVGKEPADPLTHLAYVNKTGSLQRNIRIAFDDPDHQGSGHMNLAVITGKDTRGDYYDIGLDDNSMVTMPRGDNHDGWIRI